MVKRGSLGWLVWNLVFAAAFITFGIINLIFNSNSDYQAVIIMIVGIIVVLDASIRLLLNVITVINLGKEKIYIDTRRRAVLASLELAVGISVIHLANTIRTWEIQSVEFFFRFVGDFFGIAAIVLAGLGLIYGVILAIKTKRKLIDIILIIVGAAILVTVGILILVFLKDENVLRAFFIFFGVLFLATGIMLCGGSFFLYFKHKKALAEVEKNIIQAQEEKPEEPKEE